jgi:AcrR family transcriptional regulator
METKETIIVSRVNNLPVERSAPQARIIQVAERIFLRSGFSRVSMDDLARELGMSKKTLYAHFPTKDTLVVAMIECRMEVIEAGLKAVVESTKSFSEKFRDMAQFIQLRVSEVSPAFLEDIRRFSPSGFEVVERFRARVIPLCFGRIIDEGIKEGYIEESVPRELLLRMVVLSIQGIVRPEVVMELKIHPANALDHILGIVFNGILTAKGRKSRRSLGNL